jgi:hypothetical protein
MLRMKRPAVRLATSSTVRDASAQWLFLRGASR